MDTLVMTETGTAGQINIALEKQDHPVRTITSGQFRTLFTIKGMGIAFRVPRMLQETQPDHVMLAETNNTLIWIVAFWCYIYGIPCTIARRLPTEKKSENKAPAVTIVIPVHRESPAEVELSVRSALAQIYRGSIRVCIFHDVQTVNSLPIAKMARGLGCDYFATNNGGDAKAGNLNDGLRGITPADYYVVLDAGDEMLEHHVEETVGLLEADPGVAFVQGRSQPGNTDPILQHYGNAPDIPTISALCDLFFGSEFEQCTGSAFTIRRTALESIGGFPGKCVADDHYLARKLHRNGWKSWRTKNLVARVPHAEGLLNWVLQQVRWTKGSLQLVFVYFWEEAACSIPLRARLKTAMDALVHLIESQGILSLAIPALLLPCGAEPNWLMWIVLATAEIFSLRLRILCAVWRGRNLWWELIYSTLSAYVQLCGFVDVLTSPSKQKFRDTRKGKKRTPRRQIKVLLLRPLIVYLAVYVVGLVTFVARNPAAIVSHILYSALLAGLVICNILLILESIGICRKELKKSARLATSSVTAQAA